MTNGRSFDSVQHMYLFIYLFIFSFKKDKKRKQTGQGDIKYFLKLYFL
jgi:hypothetical protein